MDLTLLEDEEKEGYYFVVYPSEETTAYKDKKWNLQIYRSYIPYLEINVYLFMKRKDDCDKFIKKWKHSFEFMWKDYFDGISERCIVTEEILDKFKEGVI